MIGKQGGGKGGEGAEENLVLKKVFILEMGISNDDMWSYTKRENSRREGEREFNNDEEFQYGEGKWNVSHWFWLGVAY